MQSPAIALPNRQNIDSYHPKPPSKHVETVKITKVLDLALLFVGLMSSKPPNSSISNRCPEIFLPNPILHGLSLRKRAVAFRLAFNRKYSQIPKVCKST